MAARRKTRQREAQLAFEALSIEGGLLSPDWLARVAQLQAGHQSEVDYRIPKGLNLRDDIGRYWRIAQAYWNDFSAGRSSGADPRQLTERFVVSLLRESFGFGTLSQASPVEIAGRTYPVGFSALGRRVPVVIAPAGSGLDTLAPAFGDGGRRRSAFGLAQELVNADEEALWALASDGVTLRILRDNASLTRPAWIEADLGRIFAEERYADFAALWLLVHETRFGRPDQPPTECALETWRNAGREEGTRAREQLRRGVEDALVAFGNGFLSHPENQALRTALQSGSLTTKDYFQQLLRLAYRLIFLLTVEERGLLHPESVPDAAKDLYARGYSMQRLRARSVKRSAFDRFSDLWEALKIVFRGLSTGEPRLGLPALAGIFATNQCAALDAAKVENRHLLTAIFRLSWLREDAGLSRVNWRDMGPEELGSVYESLLELVPQITQGGRVFGFATGGETKGNARKLTGSYYTPDSLVQVLLDSALEPVVQSTIAAHPQNPVDALLQLSIVDPACGSGHFLLAAARRLGSHVARLQANGTPSAAQYRHAVRQVVGRCIYGVDLNPMAVELCKVSLWMEAVEPGRPLSFLDSHVRQGNALLGATPELMGKGIPDEAWEPIEGDDKKVASALKKKNKKAAGGQRGFDALWAKAGESESAAVTRAVAELEAASDAELDALARKESQWQGILGSEAYKHQRFVADAWCAAFVWPKQAGELAEAAPTNELWRQIRDGQGKPPELTVKTVGDVARQYNFFHWHLAFPQVFARGGFDVVLGNPPWERMKLQEQEFFASRSDVIANAVNASARKKLIAALPETDSVLWSEWCAASREAEGQSHFVRQSGRYPLCGKGDVNTYALFAEHNRTVLGSIGRAGFIVPTGIATDEGTSGFLRSLVENRALQQIISYENEGTTFGGVNNRQSFCLLSISRVPVERTRLTFYVNQPLPEGAGHLDFELAPQEFALFNPNTANCPTFRTRRDASINLVMYRRAGVLWRDGDSGGNPWGVRFLAMLHMANDSGLFRTRAELEASGYRMIGNTFEGPKERYLPLYEAKMVVAFDHRYGTYEGATEAHYNKGFLPRLSDKDHADPRHLILPDAWVRCPEVDTVLLGRWDRNWLLGWRDICRRTDIRTVIPCIIPRAAVGHTSPLMLPNAAPDRIAALYANLCSFALDYAARQKIGGTHLTYGYLKQLPVLPPSTYDGSSTWCPGIALSDWLLARVLELTYTAWDLEPFARDVGYDGPPFRWDPARRFLLRAELDAAFFHLYGISRDDAAYVLETFPIVRRNDEKEHGEYRTKRVILEIYDALAEVTRTGKPYQTRLDPPPADPRVAHPPDPTRKKVRS
ncbi:N-6 DNA methylase [Polyangium jinanense]|uniref:Eco57I restriction-modification methylase domain-containing protein n=1 Tax=Polyangium jinanense TaxID=2829994 RepID=UPI0023426316|nr:N-6 DNA methylase [Polyangium jinanense]MDC3958543.1 N-6 DNA methylase [Polyangium jinanense]